ncbi:RING-H2 zinc finger domain-containing protein [Sarocladium implicatum]|nr:RING-H2 zinc finger domain-containing protein [Sarocladium implicatum]
MRLGWYVGVSTALAGSCVCSAFYQRPNFYSAMVYLAQSNFCMLSLVNFTLFVYGSFFYGVTRLCYGRLRAAEVEQLTERAWFAVTETCLAMTIFREEIGAWFLVMFTALISGKVWGWIGDGRVEILEQQPPANPRLFHTRLSISLAISLLYDLWILNYAVNTVIQQARPNMMVMFAFEFAVLYTTSLRSGIRYLLTIAEQHIIRTQTRKRLEERKREVREQRQRMVAERETAAAAGETPPENQEPLPDENDVDEMDIEVPGWAAKGEWVLWLDLISDTIKLAIYIAFFIMLLLFYGLPIHIMRDLFMTLRDFLKRASALIRYRHAIREMNQYPDATEEELARENTCIICREEMRPWDPANNPGAVDRVRPKKLPCGHTLHLGCLKSWLERQQVCPTCRTPVTAPRGAAGQNRGAAGLRLQFGGAAQGPNAQPGGQRQAAAAAGQNGQPQGNQGRGPRVYRFGPIQFGIGANDQQVRQLAQEFGLPQAANANNAAGNAQDAANPNPATTPLPQNQTQGSFDHLQEASSLLGRVENMLQCEATNLQNRQQELQTAQLLLAELHRLRQRPQQQLQNGASASAAATTGWSSSVPLPQGIPPPFMPGQMPFPHAPGLPNFPQIPQRISSPSVTRHILPTNGTSIPSGSAELPEGVVIPPGWSLMPLQRIDAGQGQGPQANAPFPAPPQAPNGESAAVESASTSTPTFLPAGTAPTVSNTTSPADGSARERVSSNPTAPAASAPQPPTVVAPSPTRLPNWGGSAQLFGGRAPSASRSPDASSNQSSSPVSAPQAARAMPQTRAAAPSGTRSSSSSASDSEESSADEKAEQQTLSAGKGKAKAASVESEDEDESDGD